MGEPRFNVPETELLRIGGYTWAPGTVHAPFRSKDQFEVIWVVAGSLRITSDRTSYVITPRSALLLPPGHLTQFHFDPDVSTTSSFAHFRTIDVPRDGILRRLADDSFSRSLLRELGQLERYRPPQWEQLVRHILPVAVWSLLAGDWVASAPGFPPPVERMIDLVRYHWQDGVLRSPPVSDLAAAAGVAPSHLGKLMHRAVGCGPAAALRLIRIDRAATLLRHTSLPVGRIARDTGFESGFHFSRLFASVTGASPTAYRSGSAHYELPDGVRRLSAML